MKEEKECAKCGERNNLTKDHIIPKWLTKHLNIIIGTSLEKWKIQRGRGTNNIQILCYKCNSTKGDKLDFHDNNTRDLVIDIVNKLSTQLEVTK